MKTLHITREQASQFGSDLIEYARMKDSSDRYLFKGFKVTFGDTIAVELRPSDGFEVTPIPEFIEISTDADG